MLEKAIERHPSQRDRHSIYNDSQDLPFSRRTFMTRSVQLLSFSRLEIGAITLIRLAAFPPCGTPSISSVHLLLCCLGCPIHSQPLSPQADINSNLLFKRTPSQNLSSSKHKHQFHNRPNTSFSSLHLYRPFLST